MKIPDYKKNTDKYCDYHRDKGHNTNECYHLKKLNEKMIKAGELNQFIKDLRDNMGPKKDKENMTDERKRYRGKVKAISGGSMLDWDTRPHKKVGPTGLQSISVQLRQRGHADHLHRG